MKEKTLEKQLVKSAKKLHAKAISETEAARDKIDSINESYSQQTATHRRMGMQASGIATQEGRLKAACVMEAIATAMDEGQIVFLAKVGTKPDVEAMETLTMMAHRCYVDKMNPGKTPRYSLYNETPRSNESAKCAEVDTTVYSGQLVALFQLLNKFDLETPAPLKKISDRCWHEDQQYGGNYPTTKVERTSLKAAIKSVVAAKKAADADIPSWKRRSISMPDRMIRKIKEIDRLDRLGLSTKKAIQGAVSEFIALEVKEVAPTQDPVALKLKVLARRNIAGYFPTPAPLVEKLIDLAKGGFPDQEDLSGLKALEPSAGGGHIADALRNAGAQVDTIEYNFSLAAILVEKGYPVVAGDTFDHTGEYDVIVMNPPFEKGADIEHTRHAFDNQLRSGGRLVGIMSTGAFYRSDKKATEWKEWFEAQEGWEQAVPEGGFKLSDRSTGTSTVIVVLDK